MAAIKTKYRNSLPMSDDLRLYLLQNKPRIEKLVSNMQLCMLTHLINVKF